MSTQSPRIAPLTTPDAEQQAILDKAPRLPDGTVRNIFLTLLHHPLLLKRFNAFAGTFMAFGKMSAEDRELVILRVAGRIGSCYELGQHVPLARDAGIDDERIRAVLLQPGAPALTPGDALLMTVTDELLETGGVADETWEALTARYDQDELLELLMLIGCYRMIGDVLNTVGVPLEEAVELEIDLTHVTRRAR